MEIFPAGDCGLVLSFGDSINTETHNAVRAAYCALEHFPGITEIVPTFCTLAVQYDPCRISYKRLARQLRHHLANATAAHAETPRTFFIPTCYAFSEDMDNVVAHTGLTAEEIIKRHSAVTYTIYMLGFLPGFAYLGGLDPALVTPRLKTPRTKIPAGSVGIGGEQTGIYPLDSPGGWQLIGRTPIKPYDPTRKEPILYRAGDRLRFSPISVDMYETIAAQVAAGTYEVSYE